MSPSSRPMQIIQTGSSLNFNFILLSLILRLKVNVLPIILIRWNNSLGLFTFLSIFNVFTNQLITLSTGLLLRGECWLCNSLFHGNRIYWTILILYLIEWLWLCVILLYWFIIVSIKTPSPTISVHFFLTWWSWIWHCYVLLARLGCSLLCALVHRSISCICKLRP